MRSVRFRLDYATNVADEYLAALTDKSELTGRRKPFLSREGSRLHSRLEGQAHPSYYERCLDHTILPLLHYPHLVAMQKELENWLFFYFGPREWMRAANPVKEVRYIGSWARSWRLFSTR